MPILLVLLLLGVLAYLYWKHRTTTLTRACRWRETRHADHDGQRQFTCMACGARATCPIGDTPQFCARLRK